MLIYAQRGGNVVSFKYTGYQPDMESRPYLRGFLHWHCCLNPKRAGLFWPISQPGGGRILPPLKISETDRWNIKCVVLVDSYDPPESIGTKKIQNIPCMTS